jgi:NAD-dependent deacetylase
MSAPLPEDLRRRAAALASAVAAAGRVVAFTGAGISTESGIPDFRGPRGVWKTLRPIELSEFLADPAARREYWRRKLAGYPAMRDAEPNAGHLALARLYEAGYLAAVITQNIDGLQQKAGVPDKDIIELHGSNAYVHCLACRRRYEWEEILPRFRAGETEPRCGACGGWLKPATISFGQALPEAELQRAYREAERAALMLVVGSSLQVYPAAALPEVTARAGGAVVIVNAEPTGLDDLACDILRGPAGAILGAVVEQLPGRPEAGRSEAGRPEPG